MLSTLLLRRRQPSTPSATLHAAAAAAAPHRALRTATGVAHRPRTGLSILLYSRRHDGVAQRTQLALQALPATRVTVEVCHSAGGPHEHASTSAAFARAVAQHRPDVAVCLDGDVPLGNHLSSSTDGHRPAHDSSVVALHPTLGTDVVTVVEPCGGDASAGSGSRGVSGRVWATEAVAATGPYASEPHVTADAVVRAVVASVQRSRTGTAPAVTALPTTTRGEDGKAF